MWAAAFAAALPQPPAYEPLAQGLGGRAGALAAAAGQLAGQQQHGAAGQQAGQRQPSGGGFMDSWQPAGDTGVVWEQQYVKDQEGGWVWGNHRQASAEQLQAMQDMVKANKDCFAYSMSDLPGYQEPVSIGEYHGSSAYVKPRHHNQQEQLIINEKAGELRDAGLIEQVPLTNRFAARPTIAAKKDPETGEWTQARFCVNYIPQNKGTSTVPHALPLPETIFRRFGKARFFSKIDMRSGFHQLELDQESKLRTAFWWNNELWCYRRLPFGLKNSSAVFQRVMDTVLQGAGVQGCSSAFVDDIIIYSDTPEQHVLDVRRVLRALADAGLRAHPDKSIFMAEGVEYLGHVVSPTGLQPHHARVAAFKQLRVPVTKEDLESQLGMLGFYRCYLPGYASISDPLRRMRKQKAPPVLEWDEDTKAAYAELLLGLTQEGRGLKREDASQPFILHTDWSTKGLGAILSQVDEQGNEGMVACISRSLNEHEARYPAWKGELLGVVWAVKHFRSYLAGRDFTVCTDHRPLLWMMTASELAGQQERWVLALQEFSFAVQHREGASNPADLPSRYPLTSADDVTGARLDPTGSVKRVLPKVIFATEVARQKAIQEFIDGSSVAAPGVAAALVQAVGVQQQQPAVALSAACCQLASMVSNMQPVAAAVCAQVFGGGDLCLDEWEEEEARQPVVVQQLQQWAQEVVQQQLPGRVAPAHLPGFYSSLSDGVVVVELFGGLCAGLEACLKAGWHVRRYVYADTNPAVRQLARYRVSQLALHYAEQLPVAACAEAFSLWPQDVWAVGTKHVEQVAAFGGACVLWAGWECQDLSPAGSGRGLQGPRSSTFFALHRILEQLQQCMGSRLAYVLENTAMDVPWQRSSAVLQDFEFLQQCLGQPLQLDAAQFGSRAHRLRCYWTNLAPAVELAQVLQAVQRPSGRLVQDILEPGRYCREVGRSDQPPFHVCNVVGQPMQALPTLMATVGSYAFRGVGAGTIWDARLRQWVEPTVLERELALGYGSGATAAPEASQLLRHQVLGRCMDANVVMGIVAMAQAVALQGGSVVQGCRAPVRAAAVGVVECAMVGFSLQPLVVAAVAAVAEQQEGRGSKDVWEDGVALQWLQQQQWPAGISRQEKGRVLHRARLYVWQQGAMWRKLPGGAVKVVPEPADREALVKRMHEQTGHFGVRRTAHMVAAGHWWRSLHSDVADVVRKCAVCDRARATFNAQQPTLQPLPVEPMFYRWGFDLAGEFPVTVRGYKYVLIAVEHFTKHIELIPLRDKSAEETAAAAAQVFCRFGAPAELVTDGGGEWGGEFADLLATCFVDARVTSPFHPQANGLAERIVQVAKRGLRKLCEARGTTQWDLQLPWVALGYRCSVQSSTGVTPYELLYGRPPVLPSAARPQLEAPLDFDSPEAAAASILRRAELLKVRIPLAMNNLKAAQHRDTLRYQQLRSKGYLPKVAEFLPGDFVYLKRPKLGSTLVIKARPVILRIKEVRPSGVIVLQDRAGQEVQQQASQLAPCHLPDVDGAVDRALRGTDEEAPCVVCGSADDGHVFLFCDHCNSGWHTYCCTPRLAAVPEGHFLCERCRGAGVTLGDLQEQEQVRHRLAEQAVVPDLFPIADKRRRDERAGQLHGRLVCKGRGRGVLWGRVVYKGPLERPKYFKVLYADGSVEDGLTHRMLAAGKAYGLQPEGKVPPRGVVVPAAGAPGF